MKIVGIIPARLQSSRLPRKLLLKITGKPLIQYVWETACECPDLHDVAFPLLTVPCAVSRRERTLHGNIDTQRRFLEWFLSITMRELHVRLFDTLTNSDGVDRC